MSDRPGLPVPREAPKAGFEAPQVDDPTLLNLHDYERAAAERLLRARPFLLRQRRHGRADAARQPRRVCPAAAAAAGHDRHLGDRHHGRGAGAPLVHAAVHLSHRAAPPGAPRRRAGHRPRRRGARHHHHALDVGQHRHGGGGGGRRPALVPGLPAGGCRRAARAGRARGGRGLRGVGDDRRPAAAGPARARHPGRLRAPVRRQRAERGGRGRERTGRGGRPELRRERHLVGPRVAGRLRPADHREGRPASGRRAGGVRAGRRRGPGQQPRWAAAGRRHRQPGRAAGRGGGRRATAVRSCSTAASGAGPMC